MKINSRTFLKLIKKTAYYLVMTGTFILGIAFFLSFIYLFDFKKKKGEHLGFSFDGFYKQLKYVLNQFMDFSPSSFIEYASNPTVFDGFLHSYTILGISLAIIITVGSILSIITMLSPVNLRRKLHQFLDFFEGLPDLVFIFAINMLNIILLKEYNFKIFPMYGLGSTQPIAFPVIVISFLPAILFGLFLLKSMEDEEQEHYIQFGFAKGLRKSYVYLIHLTGNILPVFIIKFRIILYMLLSNLVLVEHMYYYETAHTNQIMMQMFRGEHVLPLIYSIVMFVLPVILLEYLVKFIVKVTVIRKRGALPL
jgi:peptide/nickel transport system permease protein